MTDVFQFILLNDPAPGVPDCHTQLPGSAKGGAGKRGFVRGNTKYQEPIKFGMGFDGLLKIPTIE